MDQPMVQRRGSHSVNILEADGRAPSEEGMRTGGLCNVCLAYLSVPVMSFSIPKAGDYIDSSASLVR